jgi:hypothetical protein
MSDELPNEGYIYPMICGECLKLWVDDEPKMMGEEVITLWVNVPVRSCPRCISKRYT